MDLPLTLTKINGQLQKAVKSGARAALIVGDEFPALELRDLHTRSSSTVAMENLFDALASLTGRD